MEFDFFHLITGTRTGSYKDLKSSIKMVDQPGKLNISRNRRDWIELNQNEIKC